MDMEESGSSEESIIGVRKNMRRFRIVSSSSDEASNDSESLGNELNDHSLEEEDFESNLESDDGDNEWKKITGRQLQMNEYTEEEEFLIHNMDCDDPVSLYKLFVTDHILEIIAEETNKYATQCINNSACSSTSHQRAWKPVTKDEINTFFGILLIMGIVQVIPIISRFMQGKKMQNQSPRHILMT
ncbi:uncharacterized protein LOC126852937 [Cataglyphis hispanica]|uniref:uncharacterized protein LOC126852937 n=1 Tax=Cataglyphis hispanica TaxID=1086592 RepID=UPI00217FD69F|nr:uncharacterized protein LOC126852937 [Cataglyphis hispanica]